MPHDPLYRGVLDIVPAAFVRARRARRSSDRCADEHSQILVAEQFHRCQHRGKYFCGFQHAVESSTGGRNQF